MTMLVNEYVDTAARAECLEAHKAKRAERAAAKEHAAHAAVASNPNEAKALTAFALTLLNLLLVAAVGFNVQSAPAISWLMVMALIPVSVYTSHQLLKMFGTEDSTQE